MTPQELKYSILDHAFTGRICSQTQDETGGGYKTITLEDAPFDIPDTWKWSTLGYCCEMYTGNSISEAVKKAKYVGLQTGYDYIATKDVGFDQTISYDNGVRIPFAEGFKVAHKNAVLMCIEGGSAGRKIGILDRDVCFGNKLCSFHSQGIDSKYLFYYLQSWLFKKLFSDLMAGIIGGVSIKKLKEIVIPIAPPEEQKRIVAKLEEILPLIDRYEAAWNKLEEFNKRFPTDMQKSILQAAIQGKLVEQRPEEGTGEELFQQIQAEKQALIKASKIKKDRPLPEITEDEIPFDIPDTWKWVRVAAVTTLNPKNDLEDDLDTAFIPMPCVMDGFRNQHTFEIKKWKAIKKGFTHFADGDIGVAKITPCFQNRKSVIFRNLKNGYGAGTTELSIVRTIEETVSREYLLWFFKTDYFISNGVKSFTGTAGQQRIHKDYLATCLLPLPPLAEQKRIVAKLEEILPLCDRLK